MYTEFKTSFNEEVIVTLVAFANAKGGKVYVGVNDGGNVVGVDLGSESLAKWINEIKQKTGPSVVPDADIIEMDGKTVVELSVQEYPVKPVSAKGRYYRRQANSNHLLSLDEIANLHLQTRNSSWDFYTDPKHSIADLDMELVQQVIDRMNRRGMSIYDTPEVFLRKKELCDENGNITYGAYLLFKKREDIMTTIELGHFQDDKGILIKDSLRLKGNLVGEVEEVMAFVKKHINMAVVIVPDQVENVQRWDYPLVAIREIVLNMIVHRDYRSSADSVVKVFSNRMEFFNPGALPDGLTVEQLMSNEYGSRPRNKQIADVFKDMGEIEKYGSGIRRVCEMFEAVGLEKPVWKNTSGGVVVTVQVFGNEENPQREGDATRESDEKTVEKTVEKILALIEENPQITQVGLSKQIGLSRRGIEWNISQMKKNGLITRVGPAKGGYWKVNEVVKKD